MKSERSYKDQIQKRKTVTTNMEERKEEWNKQQSEMENKNKKDDRI